MTRTTRPTHAEVALSASLVERAASLRERARQITDDWTRRGVIARAALQCDVARDRISDDFDSAMAVLEASTMLLDTLAAYDRAASRLDGEIITTSEPTA